MFRAMCIHCMRAMWFNPHGHVWVHNYNGLHFCGTDYNGIKSLGLPIESTITPKPELIGTHRPVTPGLIP